MRVELHAIAGPETGLVIRVSGIEVRQIGRTDRADIALPQDDLLSQRHFEIETDNRICRLRDLDSANGTTVNGESVTQRVLAHGDKITAGRTTFLVKIEGGASPQELATVQASVAATAPKAPPKLQKKATFTSETCSSGLSLFRGDVAELKPGHLLEMLARQTPAYLLVDFHRLGEPYPAELGEPAYLFDWLPEEARPVASPVFLPYAGYDGAFELVEKAWGEDLVVCVFSSVEETELRAELRKRVRADANSVLGLCWPSVMACILSHLTASSVDELIAGIDAVLLEFPDFPDTWQVFARADFAARLTALGLTEKPAATAAAAEGAGSAT